MRRDAGTPEVSGGTVLSNLQLAASRVQGASALIDSDPSGIGLGHDRGGPVRHQTPERVEHRTQQDLLWVVREFIDMLCGRTPERPAKYTSRTSFHVDSLTGGTLARVQDGGQGVGGGWQGDWGESKSSESRYAQPPRRKTLKGAFSHGHIPEKHPTTSGVATQRARGRALAGWQRPSGRSELSDGLGERSRRNAQPLRL